MEIEMGPVKAIAAGLLKSPVFFGRESRSEFWWFAPIAIVPPILVGSEIAWDKFEFWGIWRVGLLMLAALPLLSAGYRRLQDAGEDGYQIFYPFMPVIILWVTYQGLFWFSWGTAFVGIGFVLGFLALLLLFPAYVFALFASFMTIGPTIGLLILPSQNGQNEFGCNPNEVPS